MKRSNIANYWETDSDLQAIFLGPKIFIALMCKHIWPQQRPAQITSLFRKNQEKERLIGPQFQRINWRNRERWQKLLPRRVEQDAQLLRISPDGSPENLVGKFLSVGNPLRLSDSNMGKSGSRNPQFFPFVRRMHYPAERLRHSFSRNGLGLANKRASQMAIAIFFCPAVLSRFVCWFVFFDAPR